MSSTEFVNYYEVLELKNGCPVSEIKKSFRRLALKYHPDKCQDADASSKFVVYFFLSFSLSLFIFLVPTLSKSLNHSSALYILCYH